ncbi:MAG: biopolymer transporter ExbD [Akkermansiaceae bacterium]|nr:biopolymer transporter ExbD [Akkermansiaceae bacterium]MCF7730520.1 biopolymer transporter ExbD [Akkermansiaceae bacterium]
MASAKFRKSTIDADSNTELDMSPMIDMVFLLLLFFLVNATAIIVRNDPEVTPPIASAGKKQKDGRGRIVINVRVDGTYWGEKHETDNYADELAISQMVKREKEKIVMQGIQPKLHLRGDEKALFKYSRTAIKAAAAAGVDQVVFTVFPKAPSTKK